MLFSDRSLTDIYTGHDAGAYTLPAPVLAAREAAERLVAGRLAAKVARDEAEATSRHAMSTGVAELVDLAAQGKPLPNPGKGIIEAREALAVAQADLQAKGGAVDANMRRLRRIVGEEAPAIITLALRPALAEVVAAVEGTAPALAGLDLANAELVMKTAERSSAYLALMAANRRYEAIRSAQLAVHRLTGNTGRLPIKAEVRNVATVPVRKNLVGAASLLDLVARGAQLWLPANAEELRHASRTSGLGERVVADRGDGQKLVARRAVAIPVEAGA